jgi:hypothetical protein
MYQPFVCAWPKSLYIVKKMSEQYQLLVCVGVSGGLGRTTSMWADGHHRTVYVGEHDEHEGAKCLVAVVPCDLRYIAVMMSVW